MEESTQSRVEEIRRDKSLAKPTSKVNVLATGEPVDNSHEPSSGKPDNPFYSLAKHGISQKVIDIIFMTYEEVEAAALLSDFETDLWSGTIKSKPLNALRAWVKRRIKDGDLPRKGFRTNHPQGVPSTSARTNCKACGGVRWVLLEGKDDAAVCPICGTN